MRDIKFRAKRSDNGEMVFGDILNGVGVKYNKKYIYPNVVLLPKDCHIMDGYEVDPKTIGQYTGLKDKNDKEIYELDVIGRVGFFNKIVVWHKNGFYTYSVNNPERLFQLNVDEYDEVIGNIHEHPNLLK